MTDTLGHRDIEDFDLRDAYRRPVEEVIARLATDPDAGLSGEQVRQRAASHGRNVLPHRHGPGRMRRWLEQVSNPLVLVLLGAAAVTAALGQYVDAGVIGGVVLLNAAVGYLQESRARQALDALARLVRTTSTVVRDRQRNTIASEELVPGDLVLLEAGDRVPADLRVLAARDLECDEAALTGESRPVGKSPDPVPAQSALVDRTAMVFSGTTVTRGTGRALVVATGAATELGSVEGLVASAEAPMTPLTRKLALFSRQLTVMIVTLATVAFAIGVLRGNTAAEMFVTAVALAVGAIPEGLPAAVTAVLAVGVVRMARRNAIVRSLPAVETLGSTTIICSDKTGTITANAMTVTEVSAGGERFSVSGTGFAPEGVVNHGSAPVDLLGHPAFVECLVTGVLCSDAELRHADGAWQTIGDPTEVALLTVAGTGGHAGRSSASGGRGDPGVP